MQSTGLRRGKGLFALLCVAWVQACPADAPRVAVVAGERDGDAADLLFATLARQRRVELVERDKLAAVLRELRLTSATRESGVRAGQLLDAQGLLFVETEGPLRHFLMVETARGERLFDLVQPAAEQVGAHFVEQVVARINRQLERLEQGERRAPRIALLPFEREEGGPRWHDLDTLTALVGATLAEHPRLIVVERDRLFSLLDETFLAGGESNAVARADFVLLARARRVAVDRLDLHLKLQPVAGGEPRRWVVPALEGDLPACARRVFDWVAEETSAGAVAPVDVAGEAAMHYQRGIVLKLQTRPESLASFAMAHALSPTNQGFAATYRAELQARWDLPYGLGQRCAYFLRAIDVEEHLAPKHKATALSLPSFLRSVAPDAPVVPPRKVVLLPFEMSGRIGGRDAGEMRRLVASLLGNFPHLEVVAESVVDDACKAHAYQPGSPSRDIVGGKLCAALGGAIPVHGGAVTQANGRVQVSLGAFQPPVYQAGHFATGRAVEIETVTGDAVRRLVSGNMPPNHANPLPWERELCRETREAAERYYRRRAGGETGYSKPNLLPIWINACPAFFATPEEAVQELRRLSALPGFDLSGVWRTFKTVRFWDAKRTEAAWRSYLDELAAQPSIPLQFQGHRAELYPFNIYDLHVGEPGPEEREATRRFCDWYVQPGVQRAFDAKLVTMSEQDVWRTMWSLAPADQDRLWDKLVTPRLVRLAPNYKGNRLSALEYLMLLLNMRWMYARGSPAEADLILGHIGQARVTLRESLGKIDADGKAGYLARAEATLSQIETSVRPKPPVAPPPPDRHQPEVAGARPLFDLRRDLPENAWTQPPALVAGRWLVEGSRAWIAFTSACGRSGEPGQVNVVCLDAAAGASRVVSLKAPGVNPVHREAPILLARTRTHMCLTEFHNVMIFPLDPSGDPDPGRVRYLGPEQGLPAIGLRNLAYQDIPYVSALAAHGDDFYLALSRPLTRDDRRYVNHGALYRWRPGEAEVTRLADCNASEPGPLNDCAPYVIEKAEAGPGEGTLSLLVRQGPLAVRERSPATLWTFTPPSIWEKAPLRPADPPAWRIATSEDGKTSTLERVVQGVAMPVHTFARDDFTHGDFAPVPNGVFWRVTRQRPLIYFVSNPAAPAPEPPK